MRYTEVERWVIEGMRRECGLMHRERERVRESERESTRRRQR